MPEQRVSISHASEIPPAWGAPRTASRRFTVAIREPRGRETFSVAWGDLTADPGVDWVVVQDDGTAWPIKKDLFARTYETAGPGRYRKVERSRYSMSLFVWYFGTNRQYADVPHHMMLLGPRYKELLRDIFKRHHLADDFSLYLHRPTATDADIVAACVGARIHDTIAALPDGYQTVVGERGYRFSGGEKQRVAIARALINDPLIIMGDEPTGNLDKKNTEVVFDIFRQLSEEYKQSLLIVTHDPNFAERTQRIIEMEDGRVIQ